MATTRGVKSVDEIIETSDSQIWIFDDIHNRRLMQITNYTERSSFTTTVVLDEATVRQIIKALRQFDFNAPEQGQEV